MDHLEQLSKGAEALLEELKEQPKGLIMVGTLLHIIERCTPYLRENKKELLTELVKKGYMSEAPRGFSLTDDGFDFMWRRYTKGVKCPHCGEVI